MDVKPCACGQPAVTDFSHLGPLCKACFVEVIERRARKAVKDFGWLQKGQEVHAVEDASAQGKAAAALFRRVIKGLPVEHVPADQAEVLVVGKTADDEAEGFLNQLFAGRLEQKSTVLNVLANISTAEIEKYCELQDIAGEPMQKSALRQKLEGLEKRYPGTMFALQKSQESFRE
jgi:tRNA(Ile)-lysidine synthase TilS/MesJ